MDEPIFCPAYEGELEKWSQGILECTECSNMFDQEVLEEMEEQP